MTVKKIAPPEKVDIHHWVIKNSRPSLTMTPQSAVGGWVPSPRKLRLASNRMAVAIQRVDITIMSPAIFGKICLVMIFVFDWPVALLASTYTCSAAVSVVARASLMYLGINAIPSARMTFSVPAGQTSFVDVDVLPETEYHYTVRAVVSPEGCRTPDSDCLSAWTLALAPPPVGLATEQPDPRPRKSPAELFMADRFGSVLDYSLS